MKKLCCLLLCLMLLCPAAVWCEENPISVSVMPHMVQYAFSVPGTNFVYVTFDTQKDSGCKVLYAADGVYEDMCYLPGTFEESRLGINVYTLSGRQIARTTVTTAADPAVGAPAAGLTADRAANKAQDVTITPVVGGVNYKFRLPGRDSVELKCKSAQEWHKITLYAGPDYVYEGRVNMLYTYADDAITLTATTGGGVVALEESVLASYIAPPTVTRAKHERLRGVTVCVDPGHQRTTQIETVGLMPGSNSTVTTRVGMAKGRETQRRESQVVLEIGMQLRNALMEEGASVAILRETQDTFVGMLDRAELANSVNADFLLHLHCNSRSGNPDTQGIEIYCPLGSPYAREVADEADYRRMGEILLAAMQEATGQSKGGVTLNNTYVGNNWAMMPSFLIEMGYMTNMEEDLKLSCPVYQQWLVQGMVEGVVRMAQLRGLIK